MSLVEINWYPGGKELRNFGRAGLIIAAIIALLLYVLKDIAVVWLLLIIGVGAAIFAASLLSLKVTRKIYLTLIIVTAPIGVAVNFVLLALFYFVLLTPLGLFFRLIGRDPLRRRFDANIKSYWRVRRSDDDLKRYFRQF